MASSTLLSSTQPLLSQQSAITNNQEHQQEGDEDDTDRTSQVEPHSSTSITLDGHHPGPQGLLDPAQQTICTQFLLSRLTQFEDAALKCQGLPIRYRDLSVFSSKIDHEIVESLPRAICRSLTRPLALAHKLWVKSSSSLTSCSKSNDHRPSGNIQAQIPILSNIDGLINQSELLLVLARPRGGMTSLLRALSLNHQSFSAVSGHLDFGSLSSERLESLGLKPLITMIEEYDEHLPSLKVLDTLALAANCRTPKSRPHRISRADWAKSELINWSTIFGFSSSTLGTCIGSEAIRGVSGGERRRVSIIEGLLTRGAVLCLDNATAGLDSANSYHLIKSLKEWCKVDRTSAAIGLRQASDGLYSLFDKVSVLHDGHQIYFGPTAEAVGYFEELGFLHTPNQPIADFLCSVTDPSTAKARQGAQIPRSPAEFVAAFKRSKHFANLKLEMIKYDSRYPSSGAAQHLISSVPAEKDAFVGARSPWTSNYFRQLAYLTSRQYALIRADLRPYITKTMINLLLSVVIGTLFYQLPKTTEAAFSRGSVLFLSVLFNGYLQLSELGNTLMGRQITQRHGKFGFYSPGALALARTLGDIPLITAQVLMFASITYGLAGLQKDPVRFGTYILLVDATAINLTAVFRMLAAVSSSFDEAMRYCGVVLNLFVIFGGYFIPTPSMGSKLKWIRYYLDPISHAFDAVLSNEFHGLELQCSPQHIIPRGPSYNDPTYQTCSSLGSRPNSLVVLGDDYLFKSYGFEYRHLWYNLGMIIGSSAVILMLSVFFTEYICFTKFGSTKLFENSASVRSKLRWMEKTLQRESESTEEGVVVDRQTLSERVRLASMASCAEDEDPSGSAQFESAVLTFSELKLSVKDQSETRILLNEVTGYFQPGELTALMGESGSGKTTLLNALAGRANYAQMSGELLLDGRLPTADSYRSIGYVEQTDCHDPYATIREALVFSALLRQPRSIPRWAKLADVDRIIGWLGLKELEDAIIGTPSAGLGLEDRKKLSIAVELVARPKILCLDEPVSGMDSQSATHIIQLLRRLASQSNLTVVVTVHQPSVEIFESFDQLILLQRGGKLAYFGPRARAVAYFEAQSTRQCSPTQHPAEYLIDSVRKSHANEDQLNYRDWHLSSEHQATVEKIGQLNSDAFSLDQSIFNNQRGGVVYAEIKELTKRFSRHFWRDSSFGFTQIFTATVVSILIGLSFFQQASSSDSVGSKRTTSLMGLQNQVFSVFLILFLPPVFMNQLIAKWFQFKAIYETREKLLGSYRELSLVIGFFLAELPYSILAGFIFWTIWFFCLGFRIELEVIGFSLLAVQMFFFFQMTWAIWIAALAPTIGIVANLLPFFLVSMEAFNGSLLPYDQMPSYWRWMYWVSPFQWYVKSVLSMVLHGQTVNCQPGESVSFLAPKSASCEEYSREFVRTHSGYLMGAPDSSGLGHSARRPQSCGYCGYSTGDEFLSDRFKTEFGQSYRSLKVFGIYCLVNFFLIFIFIIPKSGGISRFNLAKNLKTVAHNRR